MSRNDEVLYGTLDRWWAQYPRLVLENCSSGGGKCDLGMIAQFQTTWMLHLAQRPRALADLNGMTETLPAGEGPEAYRFKPRGLDRGSRFNILLDNEPDPIDGSGLSLANNGLEIRLASPLTSELLDYERRGSSWVVAQ